MKTKPVKTNQDIKTIIIDKVIKLIEKNERLPWQKPWYMPDAMNLIKGNYYHGINVFITSIAPSPFFISQGDIRSFDLKIIKGSIGYPIVFYKPLIKKDGKPIAENTYKAMGKTDQAKCDYHPLLRYSTAFCIEDIEPESMPAIIKKRLKKYTPDNYNPRIKECDDLLLKLNPIMDTGAGACYYPKTDTITMPAIGSFKDTASFYGALFHELSHWTGHKSRLNREGITQTIEKSKETYSFEELIAELSTSQICHGMGIATDIDNSTAYISGWLKRLKNDPEMLFNASKKADDIQKYLGLK